jgi:hypothetical protein
LIASIAVVRAATSVRTLAKSAAEADVFLRVAMSVDKVAIEVRIPSSSLTLLARSEFSC